MPTSNSPRPRSLDQHLEALYALARVLAGEKEADALIERVYAYAAKVPPDERPSGVRAWLFGLMMEAREGDLPPADAEVLPRNEASFTDDPFRQEVAEQTAREKLPVAFAACSIHERFILAVDVLGDPSDDVLAEVLDTSPTDAQSARDQARSALRASLRDVLKGPERMLVDVALPDESLRSLLRDLLNDRFQPAPASLRATVADLLDRARAEHAADTDDMASAPLFDRVMATVGSKVSLRGVLGGLAFVLIVGGTIGGASYLFSSSPTESPPPSVVDLSVQRADDVPVAHQTNDPEKAAAYIRETWGRRVSIPTIAKASLTGVGELSFSPSTTVPALLYTADDGSAIVALAFNYALLNQLDGRATLERTLRDKLAANDALLTDERRNQGVVMWRQRDDIFVIVAPTLPADSLRSRIQL